MQRRLKTIAIAALIAACGFAGHQAGAQTQPREIAIKNGESIDVGQVWWVVNCRSIVVGLPEIEVLEGPATVTVSIREEPVLPRRLGCANKVPGGTVVLSAKDVTDKGEAKLTYRVKYKTKDGPRQTTHAFMVSLFPSE